MQVTFVQLIALLSKYIAENDFLMAQRTAQLIADECEKFKPRDLG